MRNHNDRDEVENLLTKVRSRGIALVRGNQLTSINAISAPIFDHTDCLVAALTILGPERHFNVGWNTTAAMDMKTISWQLSERLGFRRKDS